MLHQAEIALLLTVRVVSQIIMEPKMLDPMFVFVDFGMGTLGANVMI